MEADYLQLIDMLQGITLQTLAASSPVAVQIGRVMSTSPLTIELESKLPISGDAIVLTKNTTDWTAEITVDHHTENAAGGSGDAAYESHNHGYRGRKKFLVHNSLVVGDKVILLRESGGQRYIALDRWYNPNEGASD